jgi:hypothetical protein
VERRSGTGKEWLTVAKNDGVEVQPVLINETKVGQVPCEFWSGDFDLSIALSLQQAHHRLKAIFDQRGVRAD